MILYVISFKSLTSWLNKRFNPSVNSYESDLIPVNNSGLKIGKCAAEKACCEFEEAYRISGLND